MHHTTTISPVVSFPPSVAHVRAQLLPAVDGYSRDERSYTYKDPHTDRRFDVRAMEDGRLFMSEFVPNGLYGEWHGETFANVRVVPALMEAKECPNTFFKSVVSEGLDPLGLVRIGGGFSIDARYLASLDECAELIQQSLAREEYYQCFRELTAQEKTALARKSAAGRRPFWQNRKATIEQYMVSEKGLFRGCHDAMDQPLHEESKRAILEYLNSPSKAGWLKIRNKCIVGFVTLWTCWSEVDPTAPRMGTDGGYPSAAVLRAGIKQAVERGLEEAARQIVDAPHPSGLRIVK